MRNTEQKRQVTEFMSQILSQTNTHLSMSAKLAELPEGLQKGDHSVQFQFKLPTELPSSLYFKDDAHENKPVAQNKYWLVARLVISDDRVIVYKKNILIR